MEELWSQLDSGHDFAPPALKPDATVEVPAVGCSGRSPEAARSPHKTDLEDDSRRYARKLAQYREIDSGEFCEDCGVKTVNGRLNQETERICPECQRVYERACLEEEALLGGSSRPVSIRAAPRLRMVGTDSPRHQRMLDKSAHTNTEETSASALFAELKSLNQEFKDRTGNSYPLDVLERVAVKYSTEVRSKGVVRSHPKRAILAFLVYRECIVQNRSKEEAADLMRLSSAKLARGVNRLAKIDACTEKINEDQSPDWIRATFSSLGMVYKPHDPLEDGLGEKPDTPSKLLDESDAELAKELQEATKDLLQEGKKRNIGIAALPKTRAVGGCYAVLRRAALAGRIPPHWGFGSPEDLATGQTGPVEHVAEICKRRHQTIENFLKVMYEYHSRFVPVYTKHQLYPEKLIKL